MQSEPGEMPADATRYEVDPWSGTFADRAVERRYRQDHHDDTLALIRYAIYAAIGGTALSFLFDLAIYGPQLDANTVIRGLIVAFLIAGLQVARRARDHIGLDRIAVVVVIVFTLDAAAIQYFRPGALPVGLPVMTLLTLAVHLFMPGDLRVAAGLGIFISAAMIFGVNARPDVAWDYPGVAVFIAVIANALGLAGSLRIRMVDRRQYGARLALEEAVERLGRSERARAMFVAMLSHDLRNYLNGIVGTSQIMLGADDDASWRRQARTVAEMGRNLMRLLDDALDLLRARQTELKVELSEFDVGRAIAGVTGPLRARAEAKGLRFDVKVSPLTPETVLGDEFRISQILGNLISNCIQFTARGEVSLEVAPVGDEDPPSRIRFTVADSGQVMSPEEIASLFKPDVRLDGATPNARSAGLGLYIFKTLVDRLGGTVAVKGEAGKGNRFVIELNFEPLSASRRIEAETPFADDAAARALTVLAVDDSPVNIEIIEVSLRRLGHIVVSARDGEAALRLARAQAFDIALVDLRMPGLSGEELADALRHDPAVQARGPVPLIVAVTAETFVDLPKGRAPEGFDGLLPKPINLVELSRYLGLARARQSDGNGPDNTRAAVAIDWERLAELKVDLDRGGLERVLNTGRTFVEQSLARLDRAIEDGSAEETISIAHALKGAAANIGLASVSTVAAEIEGLARRRDLASARQKVSLLRTESPSVLTAIDAWMGRPSRPDRP